MTTEVIEGTAVEVIPPERAIVPVQPGQALVAAETPTGPAEMIAKATALADALSAMVSKQKLYTEIRGKKYPHVEAWQTIGRMDNVVARESQPPIRHEDGSYEAFVELIRLSDGMVIGGASALCGTKDDVAGRQDWSKASEPSRRSMAATRATSRAFRGQYAWIMALAGYQPTPADEMPYGPDASPGESPDPGWNASGEIETLTGRVSRKGVIRLGGKKGGPTDYRLVARPGPDGHTFGFRLEVGEDKAIPQCLVSGPLGEKLFLATEGKPESLVGTVATVTGILYHVRGKENGSWYRLHVDHFTNAEWTLTAETDPAPLSVAPEPSGEPVEAETMPAFDMDELDRETGAA